jgi:hypothetical protein
MRGRPGRRSARPRPCRRAWSSQPVFGVRADDGPPVRAESQVLARRRETASDDEPHELPAGPARLGGVLAVGERRGEQGGPPAFEAAAQAASAVATRAHRKRVSATPRPLPRPTQHQYGPAPQHRQALRGQPEHLGHLQPGDSPVVTATTATLRIPKSSASYPNSTARPRVTSHFPPDPTRFSTAGTRYPSQLVEHGIAIITRPLQLCEITRFFTHFTLQETPKSRQLSTGASGDPVPPGRDDPRNSLASHPVRRQLLTWFLFGEIFH